MSNVSKSVLVMAGGTGGHIFPALAVANELKRRGHRVEWLGAKGKMEERIVPEYDIALHTVSMSGFRGKGMKGLITMPFKLLSSVMQALNILRAVKPNAVIGFGGFASAPGGLAAKLMAKPLIVHEQNAIAGMTNKLLAKFANKTMLGFSGALARGITVGNPVRKDIIEFGQQANEFDANKQSLNILVVGGSLGALKLNETLPAVFAQISKEHAIQVKHQTGRDRKAPVVKAYKEYGLNNVEVDEFIGDMAAAYAWADLVICRSGALTVAEVAIIGLPALFVPFPYAVDDHQTHNASHLVNAGGALLIQERDFDEGGEKITASIKSILNKDTLSQMSAAQKTVGQTWVKATEQVADACEQLMGVSKAASKKTDFDSESSDNESSEGSKP